MELHSQAVKSALGMLAVLLTASMHRHRQQRGTALPMCIRVLQALARQPRQVKQGQQEAVEALCGHK